MEFEDVEFMMNWINERLFLISLREALRKLYEKSKRIDMSKKVESLEIVEENLYFSDETLLETDSALNFDLPPLFDEYDEPIASKGEENTVFNGGSCFDLNLPPKFDEYGDEGTIISGFDASCYSIDDGEALGEHNQQLHSPCELFGARGQRVYMLLMMEVCDGDVGNARSACRQQVHGLIELKNYFGQQLCAANKPSNALGQQLCGANEWKMRVCSPWEMKNVSEQRVFDDTQRVLNVTQQVTWLQEVSEAPQHVGVDSGYEFEWCAKPSLNAFYSVELQAKNCAVTMGALPCSNTLFNPNFKVASNVLAFGFEFGLFTELNHLAFEFIRWVFDPGKLRLVPVLVKTCY